MALTERRIGPKDRRKPDSSYIVPKKQRLLGSRSRSQFIVTGKVAEKLKRERPRELLAVRSNGSYFVNRRIKNPIGRRSTDKRQKKQD
jgi:hypothetical protein